MQATFEDSFRTFKSYLGYYYNTTKYFIFMMFYCIKSASNLTLFYDPQPQKRGQYLKFNLFYLAI